MILILSAAILFGLSLFYQIQARIGEEQKQAREEFKKNNPHLFPSKKVNEKPVRPGMSLEDQKQLMDKLWAKEKERRKS